MRFGITGGLRVDRQHPDFDNRFEPFTGQETGGNHRPRAGSQNLKNVPPADLRWCLGERMVSGLWHDILLFNSDHRIGSTIKDSPE
jgi:hypothetical protein